MARQSLHFLKVLIFQHRHELFFQLRQLGLSFPDVLDLSNQLKLQKDSLGGLFLLLGFVGLDCGLEGLLVSLYLVL